MREGYRTVATLAAGELRLPGGRTRSFFLSAATVALLVIPVTLALSYVRTAPEPTGLPQLVFDRRSFGERAADDAELALRRAPDDPRAIAALAQAYLVRVRETADPSYYTKAAALLQAASSRLPEDADVLIAAGNLDLARHDFARALERAEQATRIAPHSPVAWGVLVDALVELGRYDEAVAAAQRMVDLRPDLASLSRVSYLRELHGDVAGAIEAMRAAIEAGHPRSEATAWSEVQLGHLLFARGDLDAAAAAYERAIARVDGYVHGLAGVARVRAARGDLVGAAELYARAVERMALPEFAAALGDVYAALGDARHAEQQYALVRATARLLAANGVRVDADLALFDADHGGDLAAALDALRAEHALRPSIHVADALAWAEYRAGDVTSAARHSREALRLGTQDPLMLYRAGVIAHASGDLERARGLLRRSAELNPRFSLLYADDLSSRLRSLE